MTACDNTCLHALRLILAISPQSTFGILKV